jgi:UDP-2,3-diacylglucosamine pyrophosphatase LpxH
MIIVVSDVHLGYKNSNVKDFDRFLEKCKDIHIDHLVLLGDILDLWRKNNADIVKDEVNAGILLKLANLNTGHIHYVIGNHDHYMLKLYERYEHNFPFTVSRSLRLEDNGKKFYFIHGYELEVIANLEPFSI